MADVGSGKIMIDTAGTFVEVTGIGSMTIPEKEYDTREWKAFDKPEKLQDIGMAGWSQGQFEGVYDSDDTSADAIVPGAVFAADKIKFYPDRNAGDYYKPDTGASIKFTSVKRLEISKGENRKLTASYIVVDGGMVEATDP